MTKICISYRRFSSKPQDRGTSLDRQEQDAIRFCEHKGWKLDETPLIDRGLSGFHGKHVAKGELGRFVKLCESGAIPEGRILLVEDLSRFSRQGISKTQSLVSRILECGIHIATINPELYLAPGDLDDLPKVLQLVVYADTYYRQSLDKQRYAKKVWNTKWEVAQTKKPISAKCPCWLKLVDGVFQVDEQKKAIIRLIFDLAIGGNGIEAICKRLESDGIEPIGTSKTWQKGFVLSLLTKRTVLGEYVAGGRSKDAPKITIPNYFPAIVDELVWHQAQAEIRGRKHKQYGPKSKTVLPLQGLCMDDASGSTMFTVSKPQKNGSTQKQLVPSAAIQGNAKYWSVPLSYVQDAVIQAVHEMKFSDNENTPQSADELEDLQNKAAALKYNLRECIKMVDDNREITSLLQSQISLERQLTTIEDRIETLKIERANKTQDVLGNIKSAWRMLQDAKSDKQRQDILRTIGAKLRLLITKVVLCKDQHEQTVLGIIHYRDGNFQDFTINLQAIKTGKGHQITIGGKYARTKQTA